MLGLLLFVAGGVALFVLWSFLSADQASAAPPVIEAPKPIGDITPPDPLPPTAPDVPDFPAPPPTEVLPQLPELPVADVTPASPPPARAPEAAPAAAPTSAASVPEPVTSTRRGGDHGPRAAAATSRPRAEAPSTGPADSEPAPDAPTRPLSDSDGGSDSAPRSVLPFSELGVLGAGAALVALARRAWLQSARAPRPLLLSAALERPG